MFARRIRTTYCKRGPNPVKAVVADPEVVRHPSPQDLFRFLLKVQNRPPFENVMLLASVVTDRESSLEISHCSIRV